MALDLQSKLARHLEDLPVLPGVVSRLLALDPADDDHADRVSELIQAEPNFSTRLLAYANSAASAPASPVISIPAAVTRVGSLGATDLVLTLGVTAVFVPRDSWDRSLWRHSIQVAIVARALTLVTRPADVTPEAAYAAGLIHDVGRFVMFQHAPADLRRIDEGSWTTPDELIAAENEICGMNHADLGALACDNWGIPELVVEAVRRHHDRVEGEPASTVERVEHLIAVADLLVFPSAALGAPPVTAEEIADRAVGQMPRWMDIGTTTLVDIVEKAAEEERRLSSLVGL
jgi:putative nucleotidyltransferase with HDIG domain